MDLGMQIIVRLIEIAEDINFFNRLPEQQIILELSFHY